MTEFVLYVLKSGFVLALFFGLYFLLFRREGYYHLNRIYILTSLVMSLVIPVLDFDYSRSNSTGANNFHYVDYVVFEMSTTMDAVKNTTVEKVNDFPIIFYLMLLGMSIAIIRIVYQLLSIYTTIRRSEIKREGKYRFVFIDEKQSGHSFFNYIFIQKVHFSMSRMRDVILHEKMHARLFHSIDLLFIGFLTIFQWFNPFIYLFRRVLVETHEYQADQAVIREGVNKEYYKRLLVEQASSTLMNGLTSSFNQSIIKNRLIMMNNLKSGSTSKIKYALVFPFVFFIGILFAVSQENIDHSIAELVIHTDRGPVVATSNMVEMNLSDDPIKIETKGGFHYNPDTEKAEFIANEINGITDKGSFSIMAENIYYYKKERRIIGFTDDYIPSISPIDKSKLKRVASGYGMRMHPILKVKNMHSGVDFSAEQGTEIKATADGVIREAEYDDKFGYYVFIDHQSEFSTAYMHMASYIVKPGEAVKKGQVIGYVGNTGISKAPHLHYEIMKDGEHVNPGDYIVYE